jgi:hypothetical protein
MTEASHSRADTGIQSILHSVFVRYGGGSDLFLPVTRASWWNAVAWTMIGLGTLAWGVVLVWTF